jgi:hypothetical protein
VTPTPSRELLVLLAIARASPQASHLDHARALLGEGIDWTRLLRLAVRNNVVPLLDRSLGTLKPVDIPEDVRALIAQTARAVRWRAIHLQARQAWLIERILRPLGAKFALIKGMTLGERHYGDPLIRHSQDIDVLLAPNDIVPVARMLRAEGWTMLNPDWQGQPLEVFCRYASVVELGSPEGVRVELHRRLDNTGLVFDSRAVLARAEPMSVAGCDAYVLSPVDEFAYVCFHHARHGWSCLHWCADLPAIMGSEGFVGAVSHVALSDSMLGPTIAASMSLASDLDRLASGVSASALVSTSPFLDRCLASIDLEMAPQRVEVRDPGEMEPDFPLPWQKSMAYRVRFTISRCRPTLTDYDAWPLELRHHWVYWLTRPWRSLGRRVKGVLRRRA